MTKLPIKRSPIDVLTIEFDNCTFSWLCAYGMSYKMIHLLCCILLLSTVGAIYPTNGVNITELKAKLNSLEAKFSVVLEEFYIERIARKELEQELNKTKLSLHIERIARKELEQELNLTKTSWSISFNDALQQVQQLKNTSNHMMQTLTSISNATMMQLHQMSISLLDTQNLQANFNKSQMEIQKELGQIESSLNTTYSNALKKMNELIRNVEVKLGENLTTMKAETNKTLQEHSVALLGVKQTVNQTMTEVSSLNSIYHDKFTKMNAFVRNSEEKLERNMTAMNTETNKKLQEHSVAILGVNHVANQTLMDLSFLNNSLMNELNNIYKSLHEQSVDMTGVKHSISGAKSSILSLNNTLNGMYHYIQFAVLLNEIIT